jgi:hypothetical protein
MDLERQLQLKTRGELQCPHSQGSKKNDSKLSLEIRSNFIMASKVKS